MNIRLTLLFFVAVFATGTYADEAGWPSQRGLFVLRYESELQPLEINTLHAWIIHIEDADGKPVAGAVVQANGGMPAHNHGLPTRPRVTEELGDGDYRLDGMRFHMAGEWEVTITIEADGTTDSVVIAVTL